MVLRLYNTLSRRIEDFSPLSFPLVGVYSCGPTVYGPAHIGNFRTYLLVDTLVRALKYAGYTVEAIQNITDVGHLIGDGDEGEDKLHAGAQREGLSALEIAEKYFSLFREDTAKLNILPPKQWVRATEHIREQIDFITILEEKGYTYRTSDGIYFDTYRFPDYGKLAGLDIGGLREGARVEKNNEKKNSTDFALWKFSPPVEQVGGKREMEWDSPWGIGFPGWHIECSAMSTKYLGEHFDLHVGGIDLLLHHTNELTQNEACFGHAVVRYWVHGEFMLVDGKKMSKSLGNTYTISDIEERGFSPLAYRYLISNTHYRQKMNFTWNALIAAQNAYDRLARAVREISPDGGTLAQDEQKKFEEKIADDLNSPGALEVLWGVIRNESYSPHDKRIFAEYADSVLGLGITTPVYKEVPELIRSLVREREEARKNGNFTRADELRSHIEDRGYTVRDTETGSVVDMGC